MSRRPTLTTTAGNPVSGNQNSMTASMLARFPTVAGELGAADAECDVRGFALKFYTPEGNWDLAGNNSQKS